MRPKKGIVGILWLFQFLVVHGKISSDERACQEASWAFGGAQCSGINEKEFNVQEELNVAIDIHCDQSDLGDVLLSSGLIVFCRDLPTLAFSQNTTLYTYGFIGAKGNKVKLTHSNLTFLNGMFPERPDLLNQWRFSEESISFWFLKIIHLNTLIPDLHPYYLISEIAQRLYVSEYFGTLECAIMLLTRHFDIYFLFTEFFLIWWMDSFAKFIPIESPLSAIGFLVPTGYILHTLFIKRKPEGQRHYGHTKLLLFSSLSLFLRSLTIASELRSQGLFINLLLGLKLLLGSSTDTQNIFEDATAFAELFPDFLRFSLGLLIIRQFFIAFKFLSIFFLVLLKFDWSLSRFHSDSVKLKPLLQACLCTTFLSFHPITFFTFFTVLIVLWLSSHHKK